MLLTIVVTQQHQEQHMAHSPVQQARPQQQGLVKLLGLLHLRIL